MIQNNLFSDIQSKIQLLEKITDIDVVYLEDVKRLSLELPEVIKASKVLIEQNETLRIGIIGQVKAGKSSFLNALLFEGKDLLPKASTPMTAGLTVIGYGEQPKFKVEYYSKEDWSTVENKAKEYDAIYEEVKNSGEFEDERSIIETTKERAGDLICSSKELVDRCGPLAKSCIGKEPLEETLNSIDELQGQLNQYVGANGEYTSVTKTLYLYLPEEGLKGIEIVDTPGINDPIVSREERTNEFLRSCHGVFLLSYSGQFCSNTDMTFLKERVYDQGISSVVVLGSKFDSGLIDIARTTDGDLGFAIKYLSDSLKQGLKEAFNKKNFSQNLPKIDCTSGLCYSLYSKDESKWDENEAHVAKLLTKNYPAFQGNKELFKALGNIEEIKSKYVESDFKGNKERIILEKIAAFNENNKTKVLSVINDSRNDLGNYLKKLESLNSESIESQRNQGSNVKKLGEKSSSIINHMIKDVNNLSETFLNKIIFEKFIHDSHIIDREFQVNHSSGYWVKPNNKYDYVVSIVDSGKLKENLKEYLGRITDQITLRWNDHFSKSGTLITEFKNEILKLLREDFVDIDPDLFQDALNNILKDISRQAEAFPKYIIENFYLERIDRIKVPNRSSWKITYDKNEQPKHILENNAEEERGVYSSAVDQIITEYKQNIKNEIYEQKDIIKEHLEDVKKSFESNISKEFAKVTEKYKKALEEKELKLKAVNEGVFILNEIEKTFDN